MLGFSAALLNRREVTWAGALPGVILIDLQTGGLRLERGTSVKFVLHRDQFQGGERE